MRKGRGASGWRFLNSRRPMIWPTNMIRIRASIKAVIICKRDQTGWRWRRGYPPVAATGEESPWDGSCRRSGKNVPSCAAAKGMRISEHHGIDRRESGHQHHDRQPLRGPETRHLLHENRTNGIINDSLGTIISRHGTPVNDTEIARSSNRTRKIDPMMALGITRSGSRTSSPRWQML